MNRNEAIRKLWEKTEPMVFITFEQFMSCFDGWEIEPFFSAGELVYIKMVKGDELHFESFGKIGGTIQMIRDCVEPVMAAHGHVRTRTPKEETRQHRFNKLVGFVAEGEDEFFIHYRMKKFKFDRRI